MPAARPKVLVDAIIDAIEQSGGSGIYLSESEQTHPREFVINYHGYNLSLWVYIWTLTHGGRVSLPYEYRIQITSVASPLAMNPLGNTILLGYHQDLRVFGGFDIQRHRTFTGYSPSVQINIQTLHDGLQNGLAFGRKDTGEVTVAIRPDQFMNYIMNAEELHTHGSDAATMDLLEDATETQEINEETLVELTPERRRIITTIEHYARSASFRQQVLDAYGHRCAVTRAQLKLVDAAHILPVPIAGSIENVTNGLALSPTMHRAFDNALIYLDEDYKMRLNERKAEVLINEHLDSGLTEMTSLLGMRVHLPANRAQWPNIDLVRRANHHRRIPGYY